jgi:hypothetical protein
VEVVFPYAMSLVIFIKSGIVTCEPQIPFGVFCDVIYEITSQLLNFGDDISVRIVLGATLTGADIKGAVNAFV